jgi:F-type H+-transporting ATPase subunit delta
MRGASRAALAAAKDRLAAALAPGSAEQASQVGDELFAVAGLLDREPGLRRALSDPSREPAARARLADGLLSGKISAVTLTQVSGLAGERWSAPRDVADAAEELAVTAIAMSADASGELDDLEDELFRFGRIVQANPGLRAALANQFAPAEGRRQLVSDLIAGKVAPAALRLITQLAAQPRGRSLDRSLDSYANLVAALRQRLVAEVRVAAPLADAQRSRLAAGLAAAYGHDVHLNVVLDPDVLGGMSVRIGDQLINGTVVSRLAELRRQAAAA